LRRRTGFDADAIFGTCPRSDGDSRGFNPDNSLRKKLILETKKGERLFFPKQTLTFFLRFAFCLFCQTELEKAVKLNVATEHRRYDEQSHRQKSKRLGQNHAESLIEHRAEQNSETSN
jgi:hypothetical protein